LWFDWYTITMFFGFTGSYAIDGVVLYPSTARVVGPVTDAHPDTSGAGSTLISCRDSNASKIVRIARATSDRLRPRPVTRPSTGPQSAASRALPARPAPPKFRNDDDNDADDDAAAIHISW
jgi:hypothetical protein